MGSSRRGGGAFAVGVLGVVIVAAIAVAFSFAFSGPSRKPLSGVLPPLFRAKAAFVDRDYENAERLARGIVETDSDDLGARALLGRILLERGRREEARKTFASILEVEGTHFEALLGLSRVYEAMGQGDLAAIYMRKAAEVRSEEAWIWRELALLQKRTGDSMGALSSAQRSLSIDPDQEDLTALMADVSSMGMPDPLGGLPGTSANPAGMPGMPKIPGLNNQPKIPGIPRPVVPDPRPKLPGTPNDPRDGR